MTGDSTISHVVIKKEMGTPSDWWFNYISCSYRKKTWGHLVSGGSTRSHVVVKKEMGTPSERRFNYISCSYRKEHGDT